MKVNFYSKVEDHLLKYAVIMARHQNKWLFCRHQDRDTYEIPGGRRELAESIDDCAKRELIEETGAKNFTLIPVAVYAVQRTDSVSDKQTQSYGMLYFAQVKELSNQLEFEIADVILADTIPDKLTYPLIQAKLFDRVVEWLLTRNNM